MPGKHPGDRPWPTRRGSAAEEGREVREAAGGTDVETYINTGNVRLTTSLRSPARVRAALTHLPGLAVCGAALDGVGVAACVASATLAVRKIAGEPVGREQGEG